MRRSGLLLAGALCGAVIMLASGAFGAAVTAGTMALQPGAAIGVSCPNALSNSAVSAKSETVNCAANATTTTSTTVASTTTTSTVPVTTTTSTTVPVTTTTTVPSGGSSGCGFESEPGTTPAFCDDFSEGPTVNGPGNSREGQLDGTVWGVARTTGNQDGNEWASAQLSTCGSNALVNPPADIQVCNGQMVDTVNDAQSVVALAAYPKQPFDFAGRTGTIDFDVSNNTEGAHSAWPELWVTDQPVPAPFVHEATFLSVPRNGFGIRFAGCTDSGGNGAGCPTGAGPTGSGTVGVDSAVTISNYAQNDSFQGGSLKVIGYGDVTESGAGQMNHYEIQVAQGQIVVYGTNAFTPGQPLPPLVHLATIPNANLSFTRGLVYVEDVHYNADKFNDQRVHSFRWDNIGFDGPTLTRDLTFDVPDNTQANNNCCAPNSSGLPGQDLGYIAGPNSTLNLTAPGVTAANITAASGALLTFQFDPQNCAAPITINAAVNGHPVSMAWPYADDVGCTPRTIAIPVPSADVQAGNNTLGFVTGNYGENVMNADLILQGAGGPGGSVG